MKIYLMGADGEGGERERERESDMTKTKFALRKFTGKWKISEKRNDIYVNNISFTKTYVWKRTCADEVFFLLL